MCAQKERIMMSEQRHRTDRHLNIFIYKLLQGPLYDFPTLVTTVEKTTKTTKTKTTKTRKHESPQHDIGHGIFGICLYPYTFTTFNTHTRYYDV